MSKYITKFSTENDYLNALDGLDYPNVSLIGQTGEVKYSVQNPHPPFQGKFKATYSDSTTYVLDCNGSTALAQSEVRGGSSPYSSMTTAEIGECVTSITANAFVGCNNLNSVNILDDGVELIEMCAFQGCSALTSVIFPDTIQYISDSAFTNCTSLTSLVLDNVQRLGNYTFDNCTSLTSVVIGDKITDIGKRCFRNCTSLNSITVNAVSPPIIAASFFGSFDNTNNCPIYVPAESVDAYKAANNWRSIASRIQAIP